MYSSLLVQNLDHRDLAIKIERLPGSHINLPHHLHPPIMENPAFDPFPHTILESLEYLHCYQKPFFRLVKPVKPTSADGIARNGNGSLNDHPNWMDFLSQKSDQFVDRFTPLLTRHILEFSRPPILQANMEPVKIDGQFF